jgi:AraC-like DNA-binding protein
VNNLIFSIFPNETFVDLGLYQFGWEKCTPSHSFGPSARNHYLFHYVLSGTGVLRADDGKGNTHTYDIKSGQGFMIFPGQITTYTADNELPWEYAWLEFDGLRVRETLDVTGISMDHPIYHAKYKDIREDMVKELMYIIHNKEASPFHLIGHMYLFLDYLTRSASLSNLPKGSKLQDYYIKEAIFYIQQNFHNDITVEDIAATCGLNRSYFGKIFKNSVGQTPQEFLLNYRMIKATELLKLTHLSIGDISSAVGYSNQLHFSRAFKNIYSVSPREWRKQNRISI